MRALPDSETGSGGYAFLAETQMNNVRMVVEPIVDRVGECRFYPLVGPARMMHCHYKCTVYYDKTIRSDWPIPFTFTDATEEVVYIDHDHLIRCAGPVVVPRTKIKRRTVAFGRGDESRKHQKPAAVLAQIRQTTAGFFVLSMNVPIGETAHRPCRFPVRPS